jgi:hypothetical protein
MVYRTADQAWSKGLDAGKSNRPGVAQRVPGGLDSKIFMIFGT